jgi:hypothetical protein
MDPRCHVIISLAFLYIELEMLLAGRRGLHGSPVSRDHLSIHRTGNAILQEGEDSMDPRCHVIIFLYIELEMLYCRKERTPWIPGVT